MIELIPDAIMGLLYAVPTTLCMGGNAYGPGWVGVTREKTNTVVTNLGVNVSSGLVPQKDFINLFDRPYNIESDKARPAVYFGVSDQELTDEEDFRVMSGGGPGKHVEYRIMTIPLYICAVAVDFYTARKQRSQLFNNIRTILAPVTNGPYWYELTVSSKGAGGGRNVVGVSSPNSGTQTVVEAYVTAAISVRYKYICSRGLA